MKKVGVGQAIDKTAATFNRFVDAALFVQETGAELKEILDKGIFQHQLSINIDNALGEDIEAFSILCLGDTAITKEQNESHFKFNTPVFSVKKYSSLSSLSDKLKARTVILSEKIPDGYVGSAVFLGVSPVLIDVVAEAHKYVEPHATEISKMTSSSRGRGRILWKESGTGEKWGLVELVPWPWFNFTPANPYIIDRSDSSHDDREWNPGLEKPTNWRDYDGLQLTTESLRYRSGTGAELKYVKQQYSWLTEFAPIVSLPTVTTADVGEC